MDNLVIAENKREVVGKIKSSATVTNKIVSEIDTFIKQLGSKKKAADFPPVPALENIPLKIRAIRGNWYIKNIEMKDETSTVSITANTVPITYKGSLTATVPIVIPYSSLIEVIIIPGYARGRRGSKINSAAIYFNLTLSQEELKELCGDTEVEEFKVITSMQSLVDSKLTGMLPYYSANSLVTRAKSQKTDIIVRIPSGQLLFLPDVDYRDIIEDSLRESYNTETAEFDPIETDINLNDIVYWNLDDHLILYLAPDRVMKGIPVAHFKEIDRSIALFTLTTNLDSLLFMFGGNESGGSLVSKAMETDYASVFEKYPPNTLRVVDSMEGIISAVIADLGDAYSPTKMNKVLGSSIDLLKESKKGHPLRRYSLVAVLSLLKEYWETIEVLKQEKVEQRANIEGATANDLPELPGNLSASLEFFPHQAEAIAKSANLGEIGIFDTATGGGKTLIILSSALKNIADTGKRSLVVVPNNLVSNWFDEINDFCDNSMNVIIFSTETVNKWGIDALMKLSKKAPQNTIFIATYKWLTLGYSSEEVGGRVIFDFPNVNLLSSLDIGEISLDESQLIKNEGSITHKACMQLSAKTGSKRLATGTLMPNLISDVVGQVAFLDPTIFGTVDQFKTEYAESVTSSGRVIAWKDTALDDINDRLKDAGALTYTRKDWFYLLPKLKEKYHIVNMTAGQQKLYDAIVQATLDEIKADPKLADMWTKMKNSSGDDEESFGPLIARLRRLERFSSAPGSDELGEFSLDDEDQISPKIEKIDSIVDKHLASTPDEKILLLTQHVDVAKDIMRYSRHSGKMLFYRGGMKETLLKFRDDPKAKILCGVDQSLRYGHNLQYASRMIRLDTHWASGDLDQVLARIYRPTGTADTREFIHFDWIIADSSIDVLKFRRIIRKMILSGRASGIVAKGEIPERQVFPVSEGTLTYDNKWKDALTEELPDYTKYRNLEEAQWEELRKTQSTDPIPVKRGKALTGEMLATPWPKGGRPPIDDSMSFDEALIQLAEDDLSKLKGYTAVTEFGEGYITSASKTKKGYSVRVKLKDGRAITLRHILIGIKPEKLKKLKKPPKVKTSKDKKQEYNIDRPGAVIRIGNREFLATKEGELHRIKKGVIVKLSYVFRDGVWVTPKGRKAKLITPNISTSLQKVMTDLGYKEKIVKPKAKEPKVREPKVLKKVKPEVPKAVRGVRLRAINMSGMLGLTLTFDPDEEALVTKAVRGNRLIDLPYLSVKVTPTLAPRIVRAITNKQLKPKNAKSLVGLLKEFRRINYKIRQIDDDTLEEIRTLLKKYMRTPHFYMYPVIRGTSLELWIPVVQPKAVAKYVSKLNQLGFKKSRILLRLFPQRSGVLPVATQLVTRLRKAKIPVINLDRFKEDIKKLKKTVKK